MPAMPTLAHVAQRHAVYTAACLCVALTSTNAPKCACCLACCAAALCWHSRAQAVFVLFSASVLTVAEGLLGLHSNAALAFPAAPPVPLWLLLPWWAVRARWVLDLHTVAALLRREPKDDGFMV